MTEVSHQEILSKENFAGKTWVAREEGYKKKNTSRFFISESKHLGRGGLEVMGKEETIRLIRPAHTSPAEIKQKSLLRRPVV